MPPPTARSKQEVGAASTFFGALVTMSAANAGADKSASAANEAAIVFVRAILVPARAVVANAIVRDEPPEVAGLCRPAAMGISIQTRARTEVKDSTPAASLGGTGANSAQSEVIWLNGAGLLRRK